MIAASGCLAFAARASAIGLSYDGCLNNAGSGGCGDLPGSPLSGAGSVAVSPDGKSVYVASSSSKSISHFSRTAQGEVQFEACLADDASGGCGDVAGAPLNGASSVDVSPDGTSVYVASFGADTVSRFSRDSDGGISFQDCLSNTMLNGCTDLPGTPIDSARSVAVSPDGTSAYVASVFSDSVSHFSRAGTGLLSFQSCLGDGLGTGCTDLGGTPLDSATSVAVSPDGTAVYVASSLSGSLTRFERAADGSLSFKECFNSGGSIGCTDLAGTPLTGATSVAASPDGKSVYVASSVSDSVSRFSRLSGGGLKYESCLSDAGSGGCADVAGSPIDGALGVAVSPNGSSVYVVAGDAGSISRFARDAAGKLIYDGCLNDTGSRGCGDLPGTPLSVPTAVTASPDGKSVYATSAFSTSLSRYSTVAAAPPPKTTITKATIQRRSRRATFKFASSQAGSTFLCKLDGGPFKTCRPPKTYTQLARGKHTFKVKAKNAGRTDPSPAQRSFTI
jgi:DNA-binding beta-propeller fold protein YncE